jgi:hypothetical protein
MSTRNAPPMSADQENFWRTYRQSSKRMAESIHEERIMNEKLDNIMGKYRGDAGKVTAKLRELAEDEENEANGLVPRYTRPKRQEMREGIRMLLGSLDDDARVATDAWVAEGRLALAKARAEAGEGLETQERIAAMMEADYLARTTRPDHLLGQAGAALGRGDAVGASVRLRAAKLAAAGKPVKGLDMVEQAVEKALDAHVPARRDAVERERQARLALIGAVTERFETQRTAFALLGNAPASAKASIGAKLSARQAG